MTPILFVTGTDTDVGKTIATAALAATLKRAGGSIAIDKPTQTGVAVGEAGDVDEIRRLSGVASVTEGIRLHRPMAPVAAAAREGTQLPSLAAHVDRIHQLAQQHDHVLVEGAGGLLVQLDDRGHTLADLAAAFGERAAMVVVGRSGLGTLNHTELTIEALRRRGLPIAGLVIGSWPAAPDDIALDNREYLSRLAVPLLAAIPANAAQLSPAAFQAAAPTWFTASVLVRS